MLHNPNYYNRSHKGNADHQPSETITTSSPASLGINRQQTRDSRKLRFGGVQRNLEDKKAEDKVRSTLLTLEQDQSEIKQITNS